MARKAGGTDSLSDAKEVIATTKSVDDMRAALAVALPLALGLSLEETARLLGRSVRGICNMRTRFIKEQSGETIQSPAKSPRRNRALLSLEREAEVLTTVLKQAASKGVVIVPPLKPEVEALLGRKISLATLYNMLARHGWRPKNKKTISLLSG